MYFWYEYKIEMVHLSNERAINRATLIPEGCSFLQRTVESEAAASPPFNRDFMSRGWVCKWDSLRIYSTIIIRCA